MKILKKIATVFLSLTMLLGSVTLADIKASAAATTVATIEVYNAVKVKVDYVVYANEDISNSIFVAKLGVIASNNTSSDKPETVIGATGRNSIAASTIPGTYPKYHLMASTNIKDSYEFDIKNNGNVFKATKLEVMVNNQSNFGFEYKGLTAYDEEGYVVYSSYGDYPYKEVINASSVNRLFQGKSAKINYKLLCYPNSNGSNKDCTGFTDKSYLEIVSASSTAASTHTYAMTGQSNASSVTGVDGVFAAVNSSNNNTEHSLEINFNSDSDSSTIINPTEYFKISVKPSYRYRFQVTGWTVYSQEGCKGDIVYASEYTDQELIYIEDEIYNAKSIKVEYDVVVGKNAASCSDKAEMIIELTSGKTNEGTDKHTFTSNSAIIGYNYSAIAGLAGALNNGTFHTVGENGDTGRSSYTLKFDMQDSGNEFGARTLRIRTIDKDTYSFEVTKVTAYDDTGCVGNVVYSYTDNYDDVTLDEVANNANAGQGKSVKIDYKIFCYPDGCNQPIDCTNFTDKAYFTIESKDGTSTSTHRYVLTGENNVDAAVRYWNQLDGGLAAVDSSHNDAIQHLSFNFDSDKDNGDIVSPSALFKITASPSFRYRIELKGYSIYSGENCTGEVVFSTSYGDGTFVDIVDEMYNAASIKVEYDVVVTDADAKSQMDQATLVVRATSGVTDKGTDWNTQEHKFCIIGADNTASSALLQGMGFTVYEADAVGSTSYDLTYNFKDGSEFNARSLKITTKDTNYYRFRIKRVTAYDGKNCTGNVVYSSTSYDYKTDAQASNHLYAAEGQSVTIDYKILCYPDGLGNSKDCTDKDDWAYLKVESKSSSDTSTRIYGLTGQNNVNGDPSEFVTLDDVFPAVNSTYNDTVNHLTINLDSDNGSGIVNPSQLFKISTKPSFRYRIEVTGYTVYNGKDGKGDVVLASEYDIKSLYSQTFGEGYSTEITYKVISNYTDTSRVPITNGYAFIALTWEADTDVYGNARSANGNVSNMIAGTYGANNSGAQVYHDGTADDGNVYKLLATFTDLNSINTPPNTAFEVSARNSDNYHIELVDVKIFDENGNVIYQENDENDTTEYEEYEIKYPEPSSTYCDLTLPGTFDWSKATAKKAGLEFTFSPAEQLAEGTKYKYVSIQGSGAYWKDYFYKGSGGQDYTVKVLASALDTDKLESIKLKLGNVCLKSVKVIYDKSVGNFYYCPVDSIKVTAPTETEYGVGSYATLTATVGTYQTDNDPVITWKSSNPSVATVDANGKVSFVGAGTVSITAVYSGNKDGIDIISDPVSFTPKAIVIDVSSVTIDAPEKTTFEVDDVVNLTAGINENATTTNRKINWSSSDPTIATVDDNGKVCFLAVGTVTITAASDASPSIKANITLESVSSDYTESTIDYTKCRTPTKIEIRKADSDLWVMAITEEQARSHAYVDIVVTRANGTTVSKRINIVNRGFKFISKNGKKIKETGVDGIYFVVVRLDNVSAAGNYSVSMTLVN